MDDSYASESMQRSVKDSLRPDNRANLQNDSENGSQDLDEKMDD